MSRCDAMKELRSRRKGRGEVEFFVIYSIGGLG